MRTKAHGSRGSRGSGRHAGGRRGAGPVAAKQRVAIQENGQASVRPDPADARSDQA